MAVSITRFTRHGENLGRLHLLSASWIEDIGGTDELTITCCEDIEKGDYLVWMDHRGIYHEHIVDEPVRTHDGNGVPTTTAVCINSIAETWDDYITDLRPRGGAYDALAAITVGTRWSVGACTQPGTYSHTFYHESVREGIQELLETWGGELATEITCDGNEVTSRKVMVVEARGNQLSRKRFTWTKDLTSIQRRVLSDNPKSRIYAYGKGEETDAGGYGRRIGIESVNDGVPYVEDADATLIWGRPKPGGGMLPAVGVYVNEQCEDPSQLLYEANKYLNQEKQPKVSYTGNAVDLASFGREWEEVDLGDRVTIIDKQFSEDGLRLQGRISRTERDLFTNDMTVTFGTLVDALTSPWAAMQARIASLMRRSSSWQLASEASPTWLDALLSALNAQYDSASTYHFESFEQGEIWSSVPLDENGHATQPGGWAMNINGRGFRLASSLNADGSWAWRAFGDGRGFTADEITVGVLGNASASSRWDLENDSLIIGSSATIGGRTASSVLNTVDATITGVDVEYAENQSSSAAPSSGWSSTAPSWREGYYIWQRTATTTASGTTYSTPTCISGRDGIDGNGITMSVIEYGTSASAATQPSSWSGTPPSIIAEGMWEWIRTTTIFDDGTTTVSYSKSYVGTDGQDGADGTSVTILGSYNTLADLRTAHPTGSIGDSYIVSGKLYIWNGSAWEDVGTIQGPQGPAGADGTSVTVTSIEYGTSNSAATAPSSWSTSAPTSITKGKWLWTRTTYSNGMTATGKSYAGTNGTSVTISSIQYGTSSSGSTQPSSWSTTVPTPTKGQWLWVKTTYSDGSTATTKSYVGTDGEDGASVSIQSASKSGGTTTVVIVDGSGTPQTLTINDGEDGANGTPGSNGLSGYVHTAWANSADGTTDFSTTVSAGKKYLGVYTDNTAADSSSPSAYSWSLIKGSDGQDGAPGEDGTGIASIVEQYYLSTDPGATMDGSWSEQQPTWASDRYIFTRSKITWDTSPATVTYTTPVLAQALNGANATAASANATSSAVQAALNNYLKFTQGIGLEVGYSGTDSRVVVYGSGVRIEDAVYEQGRITRYPVAIFENHEWDGDGISVIGPVVCIGEGDVGSMKPYSICCSQYGTVSGTSSIGVGEDVGALDSCSQAFGKETMAADVCAHAEGLRSQATGYASHAEGSDTLASGDYSHAEGSDTIASGAASHASGFCTKAGYNTQFVCGQYNSNSSNDILEVGCGMSDNERRNAFSVQNSKIYMFSSGHQGTVYVNGSTVHGSDRRIKDHDSYLNPHDAAEFVRRLRPAIYDLKSDGSTHMGFYAQDVRDAEKWGTETVIEGEDGMLSLDYTALIAPLVSYCQHLEERIRQLERGR